MGGKAFNTLLPDASFPRMPPSFYHALEQRLTPILKRFYSQVVVPPEAPEKVDHGDLDVVVCGPREGLTHDELKAALGASHGISLQGSRGMHQFAIPLASIDLEAAAPSATGPAFFQVDVSVCENADELDRVVLFTSYGDLGIILSTLSASVGLTFGHNGLRLHDPVNTNPRMSFRLSSTYTQIFSFFGLSTERLAQGFGTQLELFEWVATSTIFFPACIPTPVSASHHHGKKKKKDIRPMYQNFLIFCSQHPRGDPPHDVVQRALEYFGRKALYDLLLRFAAVRQHAKAVFTGKQVMEWTGLSGTPIRLVMDEVKAKLGGVEPLRVEIGVDSDIDPLHVTVATWEERMFGMELEEVQKLVMRTKEEMDAAGQLVFDWREAKRQKAERKALKACADTA